MPSPAASRTFPCASCQVRDRTICAALDDAELRRLDAASTAVTLEAEQTVFYEGDPDSHLFNVTTGAVRLSRLLSDGRRQITGFLFPGDILGLSVSGVYACSAEAISATSLCRFDRPRLAETAQRFPDLQHRLFLLASNELIEAQDHLMILGQKRATERVATTLLKLARRIGQEADRGVLLDLPMSRDDLADYTGLAMETVSRNISRFREQGLVEVSGARNLCIREIGALAELSGDV